MPEGRSGRLLPLTLVGAALAFNLIVLRGEIVTAQNLNDGAVHAQMVRWAHDRVETGQVPLDGWYPYLGLGSSRFHHYQSLPHIMAGYMAGLVGTEAAFRWPLYLLLSLWPISVYAGGRLLGWSRWSAGSAAMISPLLVSAPGLGYEHASYTWRGSGVWSQLWAMWLLPLAWGLSWRTIARGKAYALAALVLALSIAFHFLAGYLALLSIGVWVLFTPSQLRTRIVRAVVLGIGALTIASWVLVPLVQDARWSNQSIYLKGTIFRDSFGAPKVLSWLFTGEIFDGGRLSVVTLLVATGAVVCAARFRRDERARVLVGVTLLSLLLFFGRPTLGPLLNLLPGGDDLFLRRYIIGVHLGGIFLAGIGASWLGRLLKHRLRKMAPRIRPLPATVGVIVVGTVLLTPAWSERISFDAEGARLIRFQRGQDLTDGAAAAMLIRQARALGGGRIFAGRRGSWGDDYRVGYVPMYAVLANQDADALGFTLRTPSLSTDIETLFDDRNPAHYDLYGVKYLILPSDRQPSVEATLLDREGQHTLWVVPRVGYLEVVDTIEPIQATRADLAIQMGHFLRSDLPAQHLFPTVAFEGEPAAAPTVLGTPREPPGFVEMETAEPANGVFSGRVSARRRAVVVLKSTYDPRWSAYVDGAEKPTQMVAPSFVGVEILPGDHTVTFRYQPYPRYDLLLILGALSLLALGLLPRLNARRRRRLLRPRGDS